MCWQPGQATTPPGASRKFRAQVLASLGDDWTEGVRPHPPPRPPGAPRAWAHWCSIWKLRCPLNQSMKREGSTLQVAANCQERAGHRCGGLARSPGPTAAPSGRPSPTPGDGPRPPAAHLGAGPVPVLFVADLLGDVVHLCDPHEPVALQDPGRGVRHCPAATEGLSFLVCMMGWQQALPPAPRCLKRLGGAGSAAGQPSS